MKLSKFKDDAHEFSGKTSDINRQLAFAGIAIIWIYKQTSNAGLPEIPKELVPPLFCMAISLFFDFVQYIYSSVWIARFYRYKEKRTTTANKDPETKAPRIFSIINYTLWGLKLAATFAAYWIIIFSFLWGKLF